MRATLSSRRARRAIRVSPALTRLSTRSQLRAGMAAAAELLSPESVLAYWADLLDHYAALQTFTPRLDPTAVPASRLTSWVGWLVG